MPEKKLNRRKPTDRRRTPPENDTRRLLKVYGNVNLAELAEVKDAVLPDFHTLSAATRSIMLCYARSKTVQDVVKSMGGLVLTA